MPLGKVRAVELIDADSDGDLDFALTDNNTAASFLLAVNDGAGTFSAAIATFDGLATVDLAAGDVDADGDPDLVAANFGQNRLFTNDGAGAFSDATANLPAAVDASGSVALEDLDGDGDLDILFGNLGEQNRLYTGDVSGSFVDVTAQMLPADQEMTVSIGVGDFDGDGRRDLYLGNVPFGPFSGPPMGGPDRLYLGSPAGFQEATARLSATNSALVRVVDLDLDGDLDVLSGAILFNLTRQVARRGIARAGKPLTVEVYGGPNSFFLLAFSLNRAAIPLPPFGVLGLDPAFGSILAVGLLDAQGRANLTGRGAPNPLLVGIELDFQALVGPLPRFTSVEVTTFTDL